MAGSTRLTRPIPGVHDAPPAEPPAPDRDPAVDNPDHYGGENNPYEAIKVIRAWDLNFSLGNCVKYVARAGRKGSRLQDLKKARWYLDEEIRAEQAREQSYFDQQVTRVVEEEGTENDY